MLNPVDTLASRMHAKRIAEVSARQRYWEAQFALAAPGNNQRNCFSHEITLCIGKIKKLEAKHKQQHQQEEQAWQHQDQS
jgi:hypothetical protein